MDLALKILLAYFVMGVGFLLILWGVYHLLKADANKYIDKALMVTDGEVKANYILEAERSDQWAGEIHRTLGASLVVLWPIFFWRLIQAWWGWEG